MKPWQIIGLILLNIACLWAAHQLMGRGQSNAQILAEIQGQQNLGQRFIMMQRFRESLLQDIASASGSSPALRSLFAKYSFNPITPAAVTPLPTPNQ